MLRHLLVPTDFSPYAHQAATHAFDLIRIIGGQVTLLHVVEDDREAAAREQLQQLSQLARRPPNCLILHANQGVAAVILRAADDLRADLIVMGAHGHPDPTHSILGHGVQQVLLHAPISRASRAGQPGRSTGRGGLAGPGQALTFMEAQPPAK